VRDAVDFIAELRQASDLSALPVGRNVVVIGGGMTAVDAAVQSKLLGAETVTIVYRRGREKMSASRYEQDLARRRACGSSTTRGPWRCTATARRWRSSSNTRRGAAGPEGTGETFRLPADQVFKAIGQTLDGAPEGLALEGGKIAVTGAGRTSMAKVWAGGDCATGGEDLTVTAVAEGRDAAEDITRR
jgi:dihydropyrimidine dehydrogenase (NAD+) subunit PreT